MLNYRYKYNKDAITCLHFLLKCASHEHLQNTISPSRVTSLFIPCGMFFKLDVWRQRAVKFTELLRELMSFLPHFIMWLARKTLSPSTEFRCDKFEPTQSSTLVYTILPRYKLSHASMSDPILTVLKLAGKLFGITFQTFWLKLSWLFCLKPRTHLCNNSSFEGSS